MGKYNELIAYQNAYKLAMRIFELSKKFPREEIYSLTDQIRRSSRSVCANLAESYSDTISASICRIYLCFMASILR
nr:four helix bundle protein [Portibacter lacus]